MLRWGIAIGLVAVGIALVLLFDVAIVLREAVVFLLTFKATLKVYAMRRLAGPFWRIVTKSLMTILGVRLFRLLKTNMGALTGKLASGWRSLRPAVRWTVTSLGLFLGALAGFGIWLLPLWLPFLSPIARKLRFMLADRVIDSRLGPIRRRYRRWVRTHGAMRHARRPHRAGLYWLAIGIRRGGRAARHRIRRRLPA